ncbi:hypothetical protein AS27_10299, partial [Aptenodytes forsteri]
QFDSELLLLQSKIAREKKDFDKELEKTKEDLRNAKCLNKKLKLENKAVHQKYEQVLEEQHWAIKRDEMVAKLGKLPVSLDEKIGFLANHMMEKKNLEKEIENLEDSILKFIFPPPRNIKESYAEELASLKQDLKTENKTMVMLQWKLLYLAKQRKHFFSEEDNIIRKVNERIEACKKRHAELLLELYLEKELFQSEDQVKTLSEEASKREN